MEFYLMKILQKFWVDFEKIKYERERERAALYTALWMVQICVKNIQEIGTKKDHM